MCETSFVVNAPSSSLVAMSEVSYKEARLSNLRNYGVVNLVDFWIAVDSPCLKSTVPNSWSDSFVKYTC